MLVLSNNATTVTYNHQGGTRSKTLLRAARSPISVTAVHIKKYTLVDPSGRQLDPAEYELNQQNVSRLTLKWGTAKVDIFVMAKIKKAEKFIFPKEEERIYRS